MKSQGPNQERKEKEHEQGTQDTSHFLNRNDFLITREDS